MNSRVYTPLEFNEQINRLSSELLFARKCIKLLERHRNCLISFNNNCNCDQNIDNKNIFNLLEDEYFYVFNDKKQFHYKTYHHIDRHKTNINEEFIYCEPDLESIRINNKIIDKEKQLDQNINENIVENPLNDISAEEPILWTFRNKIIEKLKPKSNTEKTEEVKPKPFLETIRNKLNNKLKTTEDVEDINIFEPNIELKEEKVIETIDDKVKDTDSDHNKDIVDEDVTNSNNSKSNTTNQRFKGLTKETLLEGLRLKVIVEEIAFDNKLISAIRPRNRRTLETGAIVGYRCNWKDCYQIDKRKHRIADHINQTHTGERPFICNKCFANFSSRRYLRAHEDKKHSNKKMFKCKWNECNYETVNLSSLNIHHNRHIKHKPFKCDFIGCEKSFFTKRDVYVHKITGHNDSRPHLCEWPGCESTFKTSLAIKKHQVFHTREMKYLCDWPLCGAKFCHSASLRSHRMIHNGIRKHVCDWPECDKAFKAKFDLETHLRRHRNERPFKCHFNNCQKTYGVNKHLTEHLKTHQKKLESDIP